VICFDLWESYIFNNNITTIIAETTQTTITIMTESKDRLRSFTFVLPEDKILESKITNAIQTIVSMNEHVKNVFLEACQNPNDEHVLGIIDALLEQHRHHRESVMSVLCYEAGRYGNRNVIQRFLDKPLVMWKYLHEMVYGAVEGAHLSIVQDLIPRGHVLSSHSFRAVLAAGKHTNKQCFEYLLDECMKERYDWNAIFHHALEQKERKDCRLDIVMYGWLYCVKKRLELYRSETIHTEFVCRLLQDILQMRRLCMVQYLNDLIPGLANVFTDPIIIVQPNSAFLFIVYENVHIRHCFMNLTTVETNTVADCLDCFVEQSYRHIVNRVLQYEYQCVKQVADVLAELYMTATIASSSCKEKSADDTNKEKEEIIAFTFDLDTTFAFVVLHDIVARSLSLQLSEQPKSLLRNNKSKKNNNRSIKKYGKCVINANKSE